MYYGSWNGGDNGMLSITGGASPSIENSLFAQALPPGCGRKAKTGQQYYRAPFTAGRAALSIPKANATHVHNNIVAASIRHRVRS